MVFYVPNIHHMETTKRFIYFLFYEIEAIHDTICCSITKPFCLIWFVIKIHFLTNYNSDIKDHWFLLSYIPLLKTIVEVPNAWRFKVRLIQLYNIDFKRSKSI
jgi:hypothetical protein